VLLLKGRGAVLMVVSLGNGAGDGVREPLGVVVSLSLREGHLFAEPLDRLSLAYMGKGSSGLGAEGAVVSRVA
jgi:hypothetical protein